MNKIPCYNCDAPDSQYAVQLVAKVLRRSGAPSGKSVVRADDWTNFQTTVLPLCTDCWKQMESGILQFEIVRVIGE